MTVIASSPGATLGSILLMLVIGRLISRGVDDGPPDADDPDAPDEHGFIPADKYGYGYGYSWGDPYGDPDL